MRLDDVDTPALVVDLDVLNRNVQAMADHARRYGVALRPHAKTHKTAEIARLQLEAGAIGLTLAKIGEVEALLAADPALPLRDVLIAFPIVGSQKIERLLALSDRLRVTVVLDHPDVATGLGAAFAERGKRLGILVEIDTGGHRCGVRPGEPALALARTVTATPGLELRGIMTHEGHAYGASPSTLAETSQGAGRTMVETARLLRANGLDISVVSVGSTPSAHDVASVYGIAEIRPGTYVFHDYNQVRLGVARVEDCAAVVLATVVSRPTPDRAVVDAGTKAVGSDRFMIVTEREGYGLVRGQPGWFFARASEEHGVLLRDGEDHADDLHIGDRVALIPNHICTAVNLYDRLIVHRDEEVVGEWSVAARGRVR
ncbi:MAG: alanine racemase [Chloroflexi bacterium]|nr:alanine racemase [Chloroflexota bacterium]